jgi:phosphate:Na+ symporter
MLANDGSLGDISKAYKAEENINELRNMLRDSEIDDIEDNKKNYQTSVYYIDLINELEKMGDFMINVSQELERSFIK